VPKKAPEPNDSKVSIKRNYYELDGSAYDGHPLKEGEGLVVGVAIEAKEEMADALLTDLLPAGWRSKTSICPTASSGPTSSSTASRSTTAKAPPKCDTKSFATTVTSLR
jgi:Large extracellular alpha-helical protein